MELRPFQKRFLRRALAADVDTAALSIPRGNGKSFLAAHILERALTPGDSLNVPGAEYVLGASSIEQARLTFRFVRAALEPSGQYRFTDSYTRIGITHLATSTKLRVISSNAKAAMGLVGVPLAVLDEPGSFEVIGGTLMYDAMKTAQGKPGSPLRLVIIGTLAPAQSGWWHDMVADGTRGKTYVQSLTGKVDKWADMREIRRCNPLTAVSPEFLDKLKEERAEAQRDTRLRARFLSYRLNLPSADESAMLLTTADWLELAARPVPEREGRPLVGVDLGGGRAWSAAVAVFPNGRIEALAVAPGVPDIEAQEKRDRVASGTYRRLVDSGLLRLADGLQVPPVAMVWAAIQSEWGKPKALICDRFRLKELEDTVKHGVRLEPRVTRWSEASEDIRALRRGVKDGPLTVAPECRALIEASLSAAMVKNDDSGSTRLVKAGSNNTARDDVAAALTLAAGAHSRKPVKSGVRSLGLAG